MVIISHRLPTLLTLHSHLFTACCFYNRFCTCNIKGVTDWHTETQWYFNSAASRCVTSCKIKFSAA
jgi:hypothetical protein